MDQRSKELHRYIYVNFVTIKSSYIKLDFVIVIKVKIQSFAVPLEYNGTIGITVRLYHS